MILFKMYVCRMEDFQKVHVTERLKTDRQTNKEIHRGAPLLKIHYIHFSHISKNF